MSVANKADPVLSTPDFIKRSLSPRQFAQRVRVSPTTVFRWLEEGLPSAKIGVRRLIHVDTADIWLKGKLGIKSGATLEDGARSRGGVA
jgi:hypothetical protein